MPQFVNLFNDKSLWNKHSHHKHHKRSHSKKDAPANIRAVIHKKLSSDSSENTSSSHSSSSEDHRVPVRETVSYQTVNWENKHQRLWRDVPRTHRKAYKKPFESSFDAAWYKDN
jgi:hypothetical protein